MSVNSRKDILLLFDVDGTLTPSRLSIKPEIENCLLNEIRYNSLIRYGTSALVIVFCTSYTVILDPQVVLFRA